MSVHYLPIRETELKLTCARCGATTYEILPTLEARCMGCKALTSFGHIADRAQVAKGTR